MSRRFAILVYGLGLILLAPLSAASGHGNTASPPQKTLVDDHGDALPAGAIARIGTVKFAMPGGAVHLGLSKNGKLLAAAGADSGVSLWEVATGKELRRFDANFPLLDFAIAPDGDLVAIARWNALEVWDTRTKKMVHGTKGDKINRVAFTPDGKKMVALGYAPKVKDNLPTYLVWDTSTWVELKRAQGLSPSINFALCPESKRLAQPQENGVLLYDLATLTPWKTLIGTGKSIVATVFSLDGRLLTAGDEEGNVHLWQVQEGKKFASWVKHAEIKRLAFLAGGRHLLTQGDTIRIWDLEAREMIREIFVQNTDFMYFPRHFINSKSLAVSGDGTLLAAGSIPTFFAMPLGQKKLHSIPAGKMAVFSSDGKTLITGDTTLSLWDVSTRKVRKTITIGHKASPLPLVISPDGKTLGQSLCPYGASLEVSDLETAEVCYRIPEKVVPAPKLGLSHFPAKLDRPPPSPKEFLSSGCKGLLAFHEGLIILKDLRTKKVLQQIKEPKHRYWGATGVTEKILLSPNRRWLAAVLHPFCTVGEINPPPAGVYVWDTAEAKWHCLLPELPSFLGGRCAGLVFSDDNRFLAYSSRDEDSILIWEMATGALAAKVDLGNENFHTRLALSPDFRTLAYSNRKTGLRLCDTVTAQVWHVFGESRSWSDDLAFSLDGKLLASANSDYTTLIWTVPEPPWKKGKKKLSAREIESALEVLSSMDAAKAYQAVWKLVGAATQMVPLLEKRLSPKVPGANQLLALIQDLDSEQYKVRTLAVKQLTELGELAEPLLKQTLNKDISLEMRMRIQKILEQLGPQSPPQLFRKRAIMVLEYSGTPGAVQLLEQLAKRMPNSLLGQEAQTAWQRVQKKGQTN